MTFPYLWRASRTVFALLTLALASPLAAQAPTARDSAHAALQLDDSLRLKLFPTLDRYCKTTSKLAYMRDGACRHYARLFGKVSVAESLLVAYTPAPIPVPPKDSTVVVKPDTTVVVKPDTTVVVKPDTTIVVKPDTTLPAGGSKIGPATVAELPRDSIATAYPTTGRAVKVCAMVCPLQAAIDAAQPGDELLLAPGATYVGSFRLRNKGATASWIVIRTDTSLTLPNGRMTPTAAAAHRLAKILSPSNEPAMATDLSAHHWRLTGLELGAVATVPEVNAIVNFGDGSGAQNALSLVAHHLVLDRSYVRGTPTQAVHRCVNLQSAFSAIIDSWIAECHSNAGDSQGVVGWNGPGPFVIRNNRIDGGHQIIFFGGADPAIANLSPSDITIVRNHLVRPLAWRGIWGAKTLIEAKHAKRMLIEGNVIEGIYPDGQAGFAILLKSENQNGSAPWTQTADVTMRYNRLGFAPNGINIAARPGWAPAVPAARFLITDNVWDRFTHTAPNGVSIQLLGDLSDVIIAHQTFGSAGLAGIVFAGGATARTALHSNVLWSGDFGIKGDGVGSNAPTLAKYAPGALFSHNLILGIGDPAGACGPLPQPTYCPTSTPATLPMGWDARPVGADTARVSAATRGVVVAP